GAGDVLLANEVVGPAAIDRLVAVARDGDVTVAVDDLANVRELGRRATLAGVRLGAAAELAAGMGRGGPRHGGPGHDPGRAAPDGRGTFAFLHEEHVGYRYRDRAPYRVGDRVGLVPGYVPTAVNLFGAFHVVEDRRVIDRWPVLARHGDR